jgi:uncharacterized protein (TIGR03083 family)
VIDAESALQTIAADGHRLLDVAVDLEARVPTCTNWSVHDLLAHIGSVHRKVTAQVVRRATERVPPDVIDSPPEGELVREFAESGLLSLLDALEGVDPTEPMWTWSNRHEAGFFIRRMVHETAVHRFDAEAAVGDTTAVDDAQGADGIEELFGELLPYLLEHRPRPLPAGSLHLHRTDGGDGEWMLRPMGETIALGHGHEKGDAALRGPGGDLFLAMWGRIPPEQLELFGDAAVARAWVGMSP